MQMSPGLRQKIKSRKANLESIQATITMQQSIIQSASETWQAVKHEEQKRLRDTERYEKTRTISGNIAANY